jgi:hypothetical protein
MRLATARLMHPAHKPSTFLLRDDVDKVLSADPIVWPSLVETRPAWTGANVPFWENLRRLESAVSAAQETSPYRIVAASWHREAGQEHVLGPYAERTEPDVRDPAWPLVGFDVTDGSFLSGLSNCGYGEQERGLLADRWGPLLNRHHLFTEAEDALEFRALSDQRVPEHAPFHVVGLWLVRENP